MVSDKINNIKKKKKKSPFNKVKGLNIDKNEYQEIVLSNTNFPQNIVKNK